jgi:hypothetical protein
MQIENNKSFLEKLKDPASREHIGKTIEKLIKKFMPLVILIPIFFIISCNMMSDIYITLPANGLNIPVL